MRVRHGLILAAILGVSAYVADNAPANEAATPAAEPLATGPRPIGPRGAIDPAAPLLPAEVVVAMQEGRYAQAEEALARLVAGTAGAG